MNFFLSLTNMANIQIAYNWAIETCTKPNVGYSQQYRNQQTVNGVTYYDCSSFIWYALIAGGFPVVESWGTWPFTTSTMSNVLRQIGFKKHSAADEWKPGDILIKTGHTEMAFDATRTMGAHTNRVPLDEQVSINANDNRKGWLELWRWETGAVNDWIKGNRYLSIGEMQNNAAIVFSKMTEYGWTPEAISGMLGNMQKESTINPGIYQNLDSDHAQPWGFGIVQFTPYTKWTDWADEKGYHMDDGNGQLEWIQTQVTPRGEWIETSQYPISFTEFQKSKDTPENLAYTFMYNFERPTSLNQPERKEYARYWYDWYNNDYVPPDNPPDNGGEWKRKMPIWFYLERRK